ncbi:hypothetical protein JIN85_20740, partial [Luteolibacter pohnpeiensis]
DNADYYVFGTYGTTTYYMTCYLDLETEVMGTTLVQKSTRPLYKPGAFAFQRPPLDLAANLKAAMDWIPHDGTVKLVEPVTNPGPYLGKVVNIAGGRATWADMLAVPNGLTCVLETGRTTIQLGAPPAYGTNNLNRRLTGSAKDNLVI